MCRRPAPLPLPKLCCCVLALSPTAGTSRRGISSAPSSVARPAQYACRRHPMATSHRQATTCCLFSPAVGCLRLGGGFGCPDLRIALAQPGQEEFHERAADVEVF